MEDKTITVNDLKDAIGKSGLITMDGISITVKILDVKQSYGNIRYMITPWTGSGYT